MTIKILSPKQWTVQLTPEFDNVAGPAHTVVEWANVDNALEMPEDMTFVNINEANADGTLTGNHNPDKGGSVILRLAPASPSGLLFEEWERTQREASLININGTVAHSTLDLSYELFCGALVSGPRGFTMGIDVTSPRAWTFRFTQINEQNEVSALNTGQSNSQSNEDAGL